MSANDFVHLHVHTEFSLLDGFSRIKDLVKRAKALEMPALAITDHGTMFGAMDFYNACKEAEVKPIIGVEAYLAPRTRFDKDPVEDKTPFHILLLAQNQTGYKNLLKLCSIAQLEGYYYKPRIDLALLEQYSEGLIATSGCLAAKIPRLIQDGLDDKAQAWIGQFSEIFGPDRFYLELQEHDIDLQKQLNQWLINYNRSNHSRVGLLATTDLHYITKEDFEFHDTLLCIQTGALKKERERLRFADNSFYLYSAQEMWRYFNEVPEAIHNSVKIAEMCEIDLERKGYHLPLYPVPPGHDAASYLRYLCEIGIQWRFGSHADDPVLRKRLNRELETIHDMGFDTYFLIVWDLCEYARAADIWWNVRGSGAGSLAAYCLGITNIDPIQNSLLFERFLNKGRVSMPDIDLDYPDDQRSKMIAYAARKYGEDKVAAIITFGTLGPKAAVRDVARALDVPLQEVNKAAALIPQDARPKPLMTYVEELPDLKKLYDSDPVIREVINIAKELQGVNRHASTHAAGVIIADAPLTEYLPLHRITGKDSSDGALKAVTQFPMETCEEIGLLKVDFLGLSTLTIMRRAAELIEKNHGVKYTIDNLPYRHDDPRLDAKDRQRLDAAFELLGRGETIGVFQVESAGMQQTLREMKPIVFENIIAAISLYRPGPMEFIPTYNRRLHDQEEPTYKHEKLQPILEETYGIIIYQEQIMQIGTDVFGYDPTEADLMRRAVSKKKQKDLEAHKAIFMERGPANGVPEEMAATIFDEIAYFANYGFNKSHATDYAMVTVQTAFLKAHYPVEYMTAMLSVWRDDAGKLAHFLEEARRMRIPILPPDVDSSGLDFSIQQDPQSGERGIRFGLAGIKNAGEAAIQHIISAREAGGNFQNLADFCHRIPLNEVGKRTLESLVKVGAMSKFGNRQQLIKALERMISSSVAHHRDKAIGQISMFGEATGLKDDSLNHLEDSEDYPKRERLRMEKELLGLYITGRPVDAHKDALAKANTTPIDEMKQDSHIYHGNNCIIAGEIIALKKLYTKKGEPMAVMQIEDWHETAATIEVVLFPSVYTSFTSQLEEDEIKGADENKDSVGAIVKVIGKFDASRGEPQIVANRIVQNFEAFDHAENPSQAAHQAMYARHWMLEGDKANEYGYLDDNYEDYGLPEHPPGNGRSQHSATPYDSNTPPLAAPEAESDGAPQAGDSLYDEETGEVNVPPPEQPEAAHRLHIPPVEPTHTPEYNPLEPGDDYEHLEEIPPPKWLYIYFQRSDDDQNDRRRIRHLYNVLQQNPGHDKFTIIVESADEASYMLEFPNATTGYSLTLMDKLLNIVNSPENINVFDNPYYAEDNREI